MKKLPIDLAVQKCDLSAPEIGEYLQMNEIEFIERIKDRFLTKIIMFIWLSYFWYVFAAVVVFVIEKEDGGGTTTVALLAGLFVTFYIMVFCSFTYICRNLFLPKNTKIAFKTPPYFERNKIIYNAPFILFPLAAHLSGMYFLFYAIVNPTGWTRV